MIRANSTSVAQNLSLTKTDNVAMGTSSTISDLDKGMYLLLSCSTESGSETTITSSNATLVNTLHVSGSHYDNLYIVDADGSVTFTFGSRTAGTVYELTLN